MSGKSVFFYTQPLYKPIVSEIKKLVRNMTKVIRPLSVQKKIRANKEDLVVISDLKTSGLVRAGNVNFEMLSKA